MAVLPLLYNISLLEKDTAPQVVHLGQLHRDRRAKSWLPKSSVSTIKPPQTGLNTHAYKYYLHVVSTQDDIIPLALSQLILAFPCVLFLLTHTNPFLPTHMSASYPAQSLQDISSR